MRLASAELSSSESVPNVVQKTSAPKCRVVTDRRFVDSGKVITTAGVTAGIDGALHIIERFLGKQAAQWTAEEWMEYRRHPSKKVANNSR